MSICSLDQLRQLGVDSYATSSALAADRQAAIDATEANVGTLLASQYPRPWSAPYPLDLIQCIAVLASWSILISKGYNPLPGQDDNLLATVKYWRDWLAQAAIGESDVEIIASSSVVEDAGASGPSVITASQRGYSERGLGRRPGPFSGN